MVKKLYKQSFVLAILSSAKQAFGRSRIVKPKERDEVFFFQLTHDQRVEPAGINSLVQFRKWPDSVITRNM